MALFGKKKEGTPAQRPVPVNDVIRMKQQGLTSNQIVTALQREGYETHQVFDAINQADEQPAAPVNTMQEQQPMMGQMDMGMDLPPQEPQQPVEEMVEAIIDEKWQELIAGVEKIAAWKEKVEERLLDIEQKVAALHSQFDNLHKGVLGKIGEYDKTMTSVGSDVKAFEKVFQKILPTLTENVSELSRLTSGMKGKKE